MYALLSVFSLLDVILNLAQKFPAASQLPLKGIFQGIKLIGAILVGILTVSYTHLDVYKRQLPSCTSAVSPGLMP